MRRRYALFACVTHEYMLVLTGPDIDTAPRWGGFVRWIGGIRTGFGSGYRVESSK